MHNEILNCTYPKPPVNTPVFVRARAGPRTYRGFHRAVEKRGSDESNFGRGIPFPAFSLLPDKRETDLAGTRSIYLQESRDTERGPVENIDETFHARSAYIRRHENTPTCAIDIFYYY